MKKPAFRLPIALLAAVALAVGGCAVRTENQKTEVEADRLNEAAAMIRNGDRQVAAGKAQEAHGQAEKAQGKKDAGDAAIAEGQAKQRSGDALIEEGKALREK